MNRNRRRMEILAGLGIIILTGLLLSAGNTVFAEEKEEGVLYSNDFEKEDDVSNTPATNVTEYKINFKGLTDEKAHSGKKSCKIDVTVKGGHFCYWQKNLRIPLTEDITFSGYLFHAEGKHLARLGFMVVYPKAMKTEEGKYKASSGCLTVPAVSGISPGRWCQFFGDSKSIYERAKNWTLKKGYDYTDMYISGWYIDMQGYGGKFWKQKEERQVVYVDDVSINREEPEEEIY